MFVAAYNYMFFFNDFTQFFESFIKPINFIIEFVHVIINFHFSFIKVDFI